MNSTTMTDETEPRQFPDKKGPPTAFIPKNKKTAERERQKNNDINQRRKKNESSKKPTVIVYDEQKGITAYDRYGWKCWGMDVRPNDKWWGDTPIASEFADNGILACAYEANTYGHNTNQTTIFGINTRDGSIAWKNELPEQRFEKADDREMPYSAFQNEKYALILTERLTSRVHEQVDSPKHVMAFRLADGKKCWDATGYCYYLNGVLALTENYAVLSKNDKKTAGIVSLKSGKEIRTVNFGKDRSNAFCAEGKTMAYVPYSFSDKKALASICVLDESGKKQGATIVEARGGGIISSLSLSKDAGLLATATQYLDETPKGDAANEYVITVYSKQGKDYSPVWNEHTKDIVLDLKFDPKTEHLIAKTRHTSIEKAGPYGGCSKERIADTITSYDPHKGKKQWAYEWCGAYAEGYSFEYMNNQPMTLSYDGLVYLRDSDQGVRALDINNGRIVEQIRVDPVVMKGNLQNTKTNVKSIAVRKNYR